MPITIEFSFNIGDDVVAVVDPYDDSNNIGYCNLVRTKIRRIEYGGYQPYYRLASGHNVAQARIRLFTDTEGISKLVSGRLRAQAQPDSQAN